LLNSSDMTPCRRQRGYSLVEVLAGIGILGIVSTMTMPVVSTFMSQYQLRSAADQLAFEIGRARMQAVAQRVFVRVRVERDGWVRERSTDGVTYVADNAVVGLPNGITAIVSEGGSPTFNRAGLAQSSTTITLGNTHASKTITTNVIGNVDVS
jgi:prepilin-type N-terminal cleavage/methylation domain-containing protein